MSALLRTALLVSALGVGAAWAAEEPEPAVPGPPEAAVELAPEPKPAEIAPPDLPEVAVHVPPANPLARALQAALQGEPRPLRRLAPKQREAVVAFYALGAFEPVFVADGGWTAGARQVASRLADAGRDALDPSAYKVPEIAPAATPEDLAEAELLLAAAAIRYAHDARGGRVEPWRLSRHVTPKLALPEADEVLARLASASDAGEALASYNPPHEGYRRLRGKLAEARAARQAGAERELVVNMERWRWLPPDLGERHVFVNVPDYMLRIVEDGRPTHEARVMVGKPERPTPIFSSAMDHMVVNPSWTVPPTILRKDMLPALQADPSYAARRGLEVWRNGRQVAPASVDWSNLKGVSLRQPPGERNALGQIKFMFPNDHAVYIHDTPARGGFRQARRAMSSGCVRVDQPFRLAEAVLEDSGAEERLRGMIGQRSERTIRLRRPLPVHLAYFTATVDASGRIQRLADVYDLDPPLAAALGLGR